MRRFKDPNPSLRRGLERGYQGIRIMIFTKDGGLLILYVVVSMAWLLIAAPNACMRLEEIYPKTGIGIFTGLVMYLVWFFALFMAGHIRRRKRNIRIFGKPKPSLKELYRYKTRGIKGNREESEESENVKLLT